jgi:hypothetical protein
VAPRYWHRRACVQVFAAWVACSAAVLYGTEVAPADISPGHVFATLAAAFVGFIAIIMASIVKWLRNAEAHVQRSRDDAPALHRIESRISGMVRVQEGIRSDVADVRERMARVEGSFSGLQCVRGRSGCDE